MLSITASELPRFLACNGSVTMGGFSPVGQDDTDRQEGIAAHWLVEECYKNKRSPEEYIDRKAPNGTYITAEMCENILEYLNCVVRAHGVLELDTSHSGQNWEIRGRADHVYVAGFGNTLVVQDFKYGWKIVEPENNYTLISHAIGWLVKNPNKPKEVCFEIFQPRPYHPEGKVRSWTIAVEYLWNIYNTVMLPALENPKNTLQTSDNCYKCKSMTNCPAFQIANMNAIDVAEKAYNSELNNDELCFFIDEGKRAMDVLKQNLSAYEEVALHRIKTGQNVPNYSLQTDLGNSTWKKDITPEFVEMLTGIDVSKKQMKTPKQASFLGLSEDVIKTFTERPNKGVKLVRVDLSKKAEKLLRKTN